MTRRKTAAVVCLAVICSAAMVGPVYREKAIERKLAETVRLYLSLIHI